MAKDIVNLYAETDRGIVSDDPGFALTLENTSTTTGGALNLKVAATAAPTIAVLRMTNSVASGAVFQFQGFLASAASMGSIVRGVRVLTDAGSGFIPIYASATYI